MEDRLLGIVFNHLDIQLFFSHIRSMDIPSNSISDFFSDIMNYKRTGGFYTLLKHQRLFTNFK